MRHKTCCLPTHLVKFSYILWDDCDKKAIHAKYWKDDDDLDKKRRKEAEFLVLGDIPSQAILGYITYNENSKNRIVNFGADATNILIKPEYYF